MAANDSEAGRADKTVAGWVDTHMHIASLAREGREAEGVVMRAVNAGVTHMLTVGHDPAANAVCLESAGRWPERMRAAIGYDRSCIASPAPDDLLRESFALHRNLIVAVGEVGLDYARSRDDARAQRTLLEGQCALAREVRLPVIIHTRDADEDTLAMLRDHAAAAGLKDRVGVIHCFTGDSVFAGRLLDLGFAISLSGIVTFRNAERLRGVARYIPAERLLLETDAPYLAPEPHRGEVNEPALLPVVGACVARERGTSIAVLAAQTAANAARLFAWPL
ncbi:MAG: TatD family hydrolase [bacterium]